MKDFKIKTGENVTFDIINPTFIHHLDLDFDDTERLGMIDAIDMFCNAPETKHLRKSENDMLASYGNLLILKSPAIEKVKEAFIEVTDYLMKERVGKELFENVFEIHDVLVYGTIMSPGTFDSPVRHNYPWSYSGILFLKAPKNIEKGQGAVMFVNPNVCEEHAENYGVIPIENHMIVFPGHTLLKDRAFKSEDPKNIRATLNINVKYLPKNSPHPKPVASVVGDGINEEEFEKMMKKKEGNNKNEW